MVVLRVFAMLFYVTNTVSSYNEDIEVLKVINSYHRPATVSAYVCWNLDRIVKFGRNLFQTTGSTLMIQNRVTDSEEEHLPELTPSPPALAHTTLFLMDLRCNYSKTILDQAEELLLLNAPYRWILLSEGNEYNHSITTRNAELFDIKLNQLKILADSDINIITDTLYADRPIVYQAYKRNETAEVIFEDVNIEGNKCREPLAIRRWNLHGTLLRVCYVLTDNDTINHLTDYMDRHIDTITKVNYVLTNHLIDALNASRSFSFENSWGYRQPDGAWSGMLGELVTKKADIGGSPLFFTVDRVPVVDYVALPTPTRSKFVFRQPKLSYTSNVFALPFRGSVWASSGALAMLLAVLLAAAAAWERHTQDAHGTWSDAVLMTVGAICQQGSYFQLQGGVGRAVTLVLFLSLMFLYTSYSANIVALLQSSSSRIKTLSDLLSSRLKLAVHDTVFNRYYFSTATEPVRKAIYRRKIAPPGETPRFLTLEDGVKKLREGLFAFHMEIGVGYQVVGEIFKEDEKCGLQEIQYLQVVDPYLAVQKNSSYKEMFKIGMCRIQELGLQSRQNWLLYTRRPACVRGGSFVSVGLQDVRSAILLLACGIGAALALLMLEILAGHRTSIIKLNLRKCRN